MKYPVTFPEFHDLTIESKDIVLGLTNGYEAYSDFNFVSLSSWNTENRAMYSILNDNLVIKLPDYITNEPVISFIGTNSVEETIDLLLEINPELQLIPEATINSITNPDKYEIIEQNDHFDYLYSLQELQQLNGGKFKAKRRRLSKITREYGQDIKIEEFMVDIKNEESRVLAIFDEWARDKKVAGEDASNERHAITRLFANVSLLPQLILTILSQNSTDIGFSINEIGSNNKIATCHFQKTIVSHTDFDILLTNHVAQVLMDNGAESVNWEQDLGIPGLRAFKQSYHPVQMLKKYQILPR